jgi:CarD family transcriptional regulator
MQFKIGQKVIYPNQGVGVIEEICMKNIAGRKQEFYMLKMMSSNSTVMVPTENVDNVGLRKLCNKKQLVVLFEILENDCNELNTDWKNRYKNNVQRMSSGSIFEVAKVLKNLFFLSFEKSLSFREKKMFDRARQLVVSEIATVKGQSLNEIEKLVEDQLTATYERIET